MSGRRISPMARQHALENDVAEFRRQVRFWKSECAKWKAMSKEDDVMIDKLIACLKRSHQREDDYCKMLGY